MGCHFRTHCFPSCYLKSPGKTRPPFINTASCTNTMMIACFRFSYKKLAHSLSLERKEYISQISIFFSALLITYETRSGAEAKMLICEIFCQGRSVLQGSSRASLQGRSCHPPTPPSIGGRTEDTRCCLNIILLLL